MDKKKLKIVEFFDKCRWDKEENYYKVNYSEEIKEEQWEDKILIHWLSYITDRQMDFKLIWDVGGYAFSKLIVKYKKNENTVEKVMTINKGNSLFKDDKRKSKDGFALVVDYDEEGEPWKKIKHYKNNLDVDNKKIYFKSRYYRDDYILIYRTLYILQQEEYKKSLITFIYKIIDKCIKDNNNTPTPECIIKWIAIGLYKLTYENIELKKTSIDDLKIDKIKEITTDLKDNINKLFNSNQKFTLEETENQFLYKDKKSKQYEAKRLWCALRDYLKSQEFKKEFEKLIQKELDNQNLNIKFAEIFKGAEKYLELPGDVWNNNSKFGECFFVDEYDEKSQGFNKNYDKLNKFLRAEHKDNDSWYPEQFDITFNFVQRMCAQNKCNICPFNKESKLDEIKKICIHDKSKYCTVAQICCGYTAPCVCDTDKCPFYK